MYTEYHWWGGQRRERGFEMEEKFKKKCVKKTIQKIPTARARRCLLRTSVISIRERRDTSYGLRAIRLGLHRLTYGGNEKL